jgi:hypothetical protein
MELRLQQLINDMLRVANVQNMDPNNPITMRISHVTNAEVTVIVCAHREPNTQILPLNVTWFVYDPQSEYYLQALRRVSKDASTGYVHTWEVVDTFDGVFTAQFYDPVDEALLTDSSQPDAATTTTPGIARLSVPAAVPSNPVVVGANDPRLTDARTPLSHSHPQEPARQLRTQTNIVTIEGSAAPIGGATLIATSPTTAVWRRLQTSDIQ